MLRWASARPRLAVSLASSLALFVLYLLLAEASSLFVIPPQLNAVFWIPSGLVFGLFVRGRASPALWPGWLVAIFFAELVVVRTHGIPMTIASVFSVSSSLSPAIAALLARRHGADLLTLRQLRDTLTLMAITAVSVVPGALIAGAGGVLGLDAPSFVGLSLSWATSDALGVILVAPAILAWTGRYPKPTGSALEALALLVGIIGASAAVFLRHEPALLDLSLPFLLLLFVAWASIRFGPRATTVAMLVIDLAAVGATARGMGPYALSGLAPRAQFLNLQVMVAAATLLMLLLAAAIEEQRTAHASAQRLLDDVRDKEQRLRHANDKLGALTHELQSSKEEERRHIGQELHDGLGQLLTAAKMDLYMAARHQPPAIIQSRIEGAVSMIDQCIDGVRNLSRAMRPTMLDEAGLGPALSSLLEEQQRHTEVVLTLCAPAELRRFPAATEIALFRIVQEALTNVLRHADAAHVMVTLKATDDRFEVTVSDDGRGFEMDAVMAKTRASNLGLVGMRERARSIGAAFSIKSTKGHGTQVHVSLPIG